MIGTPKPTASLSSALLARKGHARPAMRPGGFVSLSPGQLDDLGWNDMGESHAAPPAPPVAPPVAVAMPLPEPVPEPPVLRQRAALDEQFGSDAVSISAPEPELEPEIVPESEPAAPAPLLAGTLARVQRVATAHKTKAAFTLRLDTDRHLRLRLATAVRNQSAQQLVTEALDAFLESLTEVDALARQLAARDGKD